MPFKNKVVIVTGSSSGIGATTAIKFASLNAKIVLNGRNREKLLEIAEQCKPAEVLPIVGDISIEENSQNLIAETVKHFGKIDILINNAGILETGSIEKTSLEQFDRVFNINVKAIYHLTMLAMPELIKSKGNIVNVSSVCGTRAFPNVLAYCMSKSALDQFTKCIALEVAEKGVRVNSVNPGVIATGLHKRGGMTDEQYTEFLVKSKGTHAMGRAGEPKEVANAIVFLASDNASFTTGELLHVDGGRHAMCPR